MRDETNKPEANSPTWPYVLAFAYAMEYKLSLNRHKGDREGWMSSTLPSLCDRVFEELEEWRTAPSTAALVEGADVANFLMFVADKHGLIHPVEADDELQSLRATKAELVNDLRLVRQMLYGVYDDECVQTALGYATRAIERSEASAKGGGE